MQQQNELLRKKKRQDEIQFSTEIGGKTSLGPSYFIPSYTFDALLLFSPPNCVTLQITPKHITNIKTWPVFACVSNGYLTKCKKLLGIKA